MTVEERADRLAGLSAHLQAAKAHRAAAYACEDARRNRGAGNTRRHEHTARRLTRSATTAALDVCPDQTARFSARRALLARGPDTGYKHNLAADAHLAAARRAGLGEPDLRSGNAFGGSHG